MADKGKTTLLQLAFINVLGVVTYLVLPIDDGWLLKPLLTVLFASLTTFACFEPASFLRNPKGVTESSHRKIRQIKIIGKVAVAVLVVWAITSPFIAG